MTSVTVRFFDGGEKKVVSTSDIVSVEGSAGMPAQNRHPTISIGSFVEVQTGDGATASAVVIDCTKAAAAASRKRQRDINEEENMDSDQTEKMESPGDIQCPPKRKRPHDHCKCTSEIENLKAEIRGIKSDIATLKQPPSNLSSDMDDLESLFSSLDGGCSPFVPLATGTTSQNMLSPPPPPPKDFMHRPRANSLPPTILCTPGTDHLPYYNSSQFAETSNPTHSDFVGLPTTPLTTTSPFKPTTQPSTSLFLNQPATQPSTSLFLNQPATQPSTGPFLNRPATQPSTGPFLNQPATQPSTGPFLNQPATQPSFQLATQPSTGPFQLATQSSTTLFPLAGPIATQPVDTWPSKAPQQRPKLRVPMPIPSYMPLKSAEHIFAKYSKYLTKDMVSRVAVKLARSTYFGESVLEGSSIGGTEDTRPLDPHVLLKMKTALREKYPPVSPTEFEMVWGKCVDSLSRLCTYLRNKAKTN